MAARALCLYRAKHLDLFQNTALLDIAHLTK